MRQADFFPYELDKNSAGLSAEYLRGVALTVLQLPGLCASLGQCCP